MTIEGYSNSEWQANAQSEGTYSPTQLFTGSDDVSTEPALVLTGQNLAVLTLVAFNAANKIVPWAPAATQAVSGGASGQTEPAPQSKLVGILTMDADTTTVAGDRQFEIYRSGCFNPDLLVWPAALDTWVKRQAAIASQRGMIRVKRLA